MSAVADCTDYCAASPGPPRALAAGMVLRMNQERPELLVKYSPSRVALVDINGYLHTWLCVVDPGCLTRDEVLEMLGDFVGWQILGTLEDLYEGRIQL